MTCRRSTGRTGVHPTHHRGAARPALGCRGLDLRLALIRAHTEPSAPTRAAEVVMAWIEQTGVHSWRVRYPRPAGGYGSQSGFASRKAARDYADDLESDRR